MSARRAFTLVELLVVIGIIALLVSILLPTLGDARRRAAATKCAAHLRDIGNAFQMYALEQRGFYPPASLRISATGVTYNIDGTNYSRNSFAYWTNFVAKYVTRAQLGNAVTTAEDAGAARRSILWGCPSFDGYSSTGTVGGTNMVQTGYGMNGYPTFNPGYPTTNFPPAREHNIIDGWSPTAQPTSGRWTKQNVYTKNGAERILIADSRFWVADSNPAQADGGVPTQSVLVNLASVGIYSAPNQSTIDLYRHGKYPPRHPTIANTFSNRGGRIAYNALFADGHVSMLDDHRTAFKGIRMRYPN